jgi:hypothetical protein
MSRTLRLSVRVDEQRYESIEGTDYKLMYSTYLIREFYSRSFEDELVSLDVIEELGEIDCQEINVADAIDVIEAEISSDSESDIHSDVKILLAGLEAIRDDFDEEYAYIEVW